ncbi:MAG: DUF5686 family protein [Ferruginibacter sp.]
MHRCLPVLFYVLLLSFSSAAQTGKLSGTVYDTITKAPLAFVSVSIKGTNKGVVTDIDGHFSLDQLPGNTTLLISYIGYKIKEYDAGKNNPSDLRIFIERKGSQLENVVISANENPAHRIIRLLQKNKKKNDPESKLTFKYNAYTIAALSAGSRFWNMNSTDTTKQKKQPVEKLVQKTKDTAGDKLGAMLAQRFKENHLMLTESYTERIFRYPNQTKETVLATKVSGIKEAAFGITGSDFQPFGFYRDYLQMNTESYVSPVANGSISMYKFRLTETLLHEKDTTFIISFEPRAGKNFNGLKGVIYINSDGYAIENVIASPADETGLIFTFRLQQKYEKVEGNWFPVQLNTTLSQKDLLTDSVMLYWDSRCYITNAIFSKTFLRSAFSDVQIEYHPLAGRRPDTAWKLMRADTLNQKSKMTYETFELLPPKYKNMIGKANSAIKILTIEGIPWGKVDIPFKYILSGINKYERFRLGAGLQTNPSFSKWFSVGGFGGYGIKDKAWKYGANILFSIDQRTSTTIRFNYSRDILEPGNVDYFVRNGSVFSNQSLRNFLRSRMDSIEQYKVDLSTKLRPSLQSDIWLLNELRNPAGYEYDYKDATTNKDLRRFRNTELGVGFRLTHGESFTRMGRAKIRTKPATTQLLLQVSKGIKGLLDGDLNYTKAAIQFNHRFQFKKLGQTSLQVEAGQVWGDVPYSYLFNTKATHSGRLSVYVPNNFQTVGLYEFVSSRTASVFMEHNFGSLLFKPKNISIRPEIFLIQNISYGRLDNAALQKNIEFKVPEKGLFESGLLVKNLYRRRFLSVVYVGLGGGVFYRYGHYALSKAIDNWAFKWGFSISY